jgi:glycosyltransferase involved in cell wall biosynthesis
MRIYAFAELHPSPYKPYYDTQFEQLRADGHVLRLFAFGHHDGELAPAAQRLGLPTRYLPATLRQLRAALPKMAKAVRRHPGRARRMVRAARAAGGPKAALLEWARALLLPATTPDLCLVHNLLAMVHLCGLRAIYPGVPIALYYHGGELPGVPGPGPDRVAAAFAAADLVFTNTESARANAIGRGCPPDKVVVVPVGFALRDFPAPVGRRYRRDGLLRVIGVGRLSEEKGTLLALEALRELRGRGLSQVRYRIVGDGPERARVERTVAEYGLGDAVELLGRVSQEALYHEYLEADVLLLPSVKLGNWEENQACVVQEAMLAEALVAVSRTGGVPESIAPGMERFAFEPGDAHGIADALARLCALDEESMAALGREGRRFVETHYDVALTNRRLLEVVRRRFPESAAFPAAALPAPAYDPGRGKEVPT